LALKKAVLFFSNCNYKALDFLVVLAFFGDLGFAGILVRGAFGFFVGICAPFLALNVDSLGMAADFTADFCGDLAL
jgi:hypothetical protein